MYIIISMTLRTGGFSSSLFRLSLFFLILHDCQHKISYPVTHVTVVKEKSGAEERILTMRVDSSQKEDSTSSFRGLVRTLPLSSLLSPSPLLVSSLIAPHPFSFPNTRCFAPFIYRKHANPRSGSRPFSSCEQKPTGWSSFRMRDKLLNSLPFSFPTRDSISVILVLFYVASV